MNYILIFLNIDQAIAKEKDKDVFEGLEQNFVDIRVVNNSNDKSEIIKSEKGIFVSEKRKYGIEILFLVYSDVRSSQIIFKELMMCINENIKMIMERVLES